MQQRHPINSALVTARKEGVTCAFIAHPRVLEELAKLRFEHTVHDPLIYYVVQHVFESGTGTEWLGVAVDFNHGFEFDPARWDQSLVIDSDNEYFQATQTEYIKAVCSEKMHPFPRFVGGYQEA